MTEKEKYIGESQLLRVPQKGMRFVIKDKSISESKLSEEVQEKLNSRLMTYSLGFYDDETPPSPIVMLMVRPESINETVVPYLLQNQADYSSHVLEWKWERKSAFPEADSYWNIQEKASRRILNLTNADFPSGWTLDGNSLSFKCTVVFEDESGEQQELINVVVIK